MTNLENRLKFLESNFYAINNEDLKKLLFSFRNLNINYDIFKFIIENLNIINIKITELNKYKEFLEEVIGKCNE